MNFVQVFKKFECLGKALNFIIKNGKGINNPYHNLNHNITTTIYAYYIGKAEKLSEKEMKEIVIAAIFHDYNHSAGKEKDNENVRMAKEGVEEFIKKEKIDDVDLDKIKEIIDATEYPYTIEEDKLNRQQTIIRDADFLQLVEPVRLQFNLIGLQKEYNAEYNKQLENQTKFVDGVKFRTKFAKALYSRFEKEIQEELKYLHQINK